MTVNFTTLRQIAQFAALGLIAIGLAEWAGFQTPVRGEWWQIMIAAAAIRLGV